MSNEKPKAEKSIHVWWHAPLAGLFAGIYGALTAFPFEAAKKRAQSLQTQPWKIPGWYLNPLSFIKEIYRGVSSFVFSLGPVTTVQVTALDALEKKIPQQTAYTKIGMSLLSGAMGGLVSAPVEHLILTQQKHHFNTLAAIKYLVAQGATYPWTAVDVYLFREAIFGFTYLIGADAVSDYVNSKFQQDFTIPVKLAVGWIGAGISHPFDSMGTYKQLSKERISFLKAYSEIKANFGYAGFYKGYYHRAFLYSICVLSIGSTEKKIKAFLNDGEHHLLFKKRIHRQTAKITEITDLTPPKNFDYTVKFDETPVVEETKNRKRAL